MFKEDWAESQLCQLTQSSTSTPWELWECKKVRGCCSKKKCSRYSGLQNVWNELKCVAGCLEGSVEPAKCSG